MFEVTAAVDPLVSDAEKSTDEYGLKLLQASVITWQTGYNSQSRQNRKQRFDYNRSYALGKYNMDEFKDILDLDGEFSVVNIPMDPLPILVPYLNRLKDRYNQRDEVIQCYAVDPFTVGNKQTAKESALFKLKFAEDIKAVQQEAGMPLEEFSDNDPQTEADIEMEFGFSYKERGEVIMENLIRIVFYENNFSDVVKDRILNDLINCGYAGTKVYVDGTGRIKIRFIKPENLITSYTEWNDFRDWQYLGEVYYQTIQEVRMLYPGKIDEKKLYELSMSLIGQYGNQSIAGFTWSPLYYTSLSRPYDGWRVPVVELDFKTLYNVKKTVITNKFGNEAIVDEVTNPNADVSTLESEPYYVSYTGVYILDTNYLLQWELSKNMVKPEENLEEIYSQYVCYMYDNTEMSNKPLMEQLIPSVKKMTMYELQKLKIVAAAAPDGYDIDVALMSDISLDGGDTTMSPQGLYEVYKQTGIRYYKSIPDEGIEGGTRRVPIQANNVPFSAKLEELRNLYNAELLTITNLISNELDSGLLRNQATGAKVLQEAKQTGESTSNYIYNSFLNIMQRTAKIVQLRGWDILMYGKKFGMNFYDGYRQALGTQKIEYIKLEATDDWDKTAYDVQIKTVIGDVEQAELEQSLLTALTNDKIEYSDYLDIKELAVTNIKWAAYVFSQRLNARKRQAQQDQMALSQQNTQAAVAGAQAKTQGDMQLAELQAQNDTAKDLRNRETQLMVEDSKFFGILKANLVTSTLAKPGATIADLPTFVFEGVPLQKVIEHANDMNYLQTMAQAMNLQQGGDSQQQDSQPSTDNGTQGLENSPQTSQQPQQSPQTNQEAA